MQNWSRQLIFTSANSNPCLSNGSLADTATTFIPAAKAAWIPDPESSKAIPLSSLLKKAYQRYGKPVVLSETGHFDDKRADWIQEISEECLQAIAMGTELGGICIYPVIERPDWDNLNHRHKSGLWDLDAFKNRIPHGESLLMLKAYRESFARMAQPSFTPAVVDNNSPLGHNQAP